MTQNQLRKRELAMAATFVLALVVTALLGHVTGSRGDGEDLRSAAPEQQLEGDAREEAVTAADRRAERVKQRLERGTGERYSRESVKNALDERQDLLTRTVTVRVTSGGTGSSVQAAEWSFSPAAHPGVLEFHHGWTAARFRVNRENLRNVLVSAEIPGMKELVIPTVRNIASDGYVLRADASAVARSGFAYDTAALAETIADALEKGTERVELTLPYEEAYIKLVTASGTQVLTRIGTGVSDYSDSPDARISNVHKAINERVNNVAVQPGEKFSFVATLGGPVTLDKGWKEALGLFGGGTALTPGGGICQAATTVFRAALLAGLPITERRNHSVFVDHYEPYGVGLDATIFPGVHDLSFRNDTSSVIIMQAYTEGDDVYVHFYGTEDGRTVNLDGPYFMGTRPRAAELRPLGKDQIGWVYHVTYGDGRTATKPFIATYYTGFFRSVTTTWAGTPGTKLLYPKTQDAL